MAPVLAVRRALRVRRAHAAPLRRRRGAGRGRGRRRRAVVRRRGRQVGRVELHVAGHEEVELPVPVVVAEGAAGRPSLHGHARGGGDVGEGPVAVVAIQPAAAEVGDEQVFPAVAVEVARADALSPAPIVHARGGRHVGERAVVVVVEERRRRRLVPSRQCGQRGAVHEVHVEPSVVVVVHQRDAGAGRLDDVVLGRAAGDMVERGQARRRGGIGEDDSGRGGRGGRRDHGGRGSLLRQEEAQQRRTGREAARGHSLPTAPRATASGRASSPGPADPRTARLRFSVSLFTFSNAAAASSRRPSVVRARPSR